MKPALRHAPVQRHLSAFKTAPTRIAASRLLTLVSRARGLAELRPHASANAHFALSRACRRLQIRERKQAASFGRRLRRFVLTAHLIFTMPPDFLPSCSVRLKTLTGAFVLATFLPIIRRPHSLRLFPWPACR